MPTLLFGQGMRPTVPGLYELMKQAQETQERLAVAQARILPARVEKAQRVSGGNHLSE